MEDRIVIAIIVVASTVVTPNLISWFPKYRLGSDARNILSSLQLIRIRVIKENTAIYAMSFNSANDPYTVFKDSTTDFSEPEAQ